MKLIDPVSALATASAAYNVIKKGFEIGREVEDMAGDLSRWMGAMSDLNKASDAAKKPPLFKKLVASKSVEQEAMDAFAAKLKADQMRDDLRNMISLLHGPSKWNELVQMEVKIRKQRQEMIYKQKERQQFWIDVFLVIIATCIGVAALVGFIWLLMNHGGY